MVTYKRFDGRRDRHAVAIVAMANSNISFTGVDVKYIDWGTYDDNTFRLVAAVTGVSGVTSIKQYTVGFHGSLTSVDAVAGFHFTAVPWNPV